MPLLNDVQSQLNATEVARVVTPATVQEISAVIAEASAQGIVVCPAGALHSMGGQQFARGGISVSSSRLAKIGPLNPDSANVWVQAGVKWPEFGEMAPGCAGGTDGRTYNHPETDRCG